MINRDFCEVLECWINTALKQDSSVLKHFWCDGVLDNQYDIYYSKKFMNDKRSTLLKVFTGESGQVEYELILRFGPKALSRFARDLPLIECMPDPEAGFSIDPESRTCVIQLL